MLRYKERRRDWQCSMLGRPPGHVAGSILPILYTSPLRLRQADGISYCYLRFNRGVTKNVS